VYAGLRYLSQHAAEAPRPQARSSSCRGGGGVSSKFGTKSLVNLVSEVAEPAAVDCSHAHALHSEMRVEALRCHPHMYFSSLRKCGSRLKASYTGTFVAEEEMRVEELR
jgi:hypothetical protein